MAEKRFASVFAGVEISREKIREILDLPEGVVVSDELLYHKGLMRRFVRKYLYLFAELSGRADQGVAAELGEAERQRYVADLAIAYKGEMTGKAIWDCLPYGEVYPEILPILYVAWAFGLVKIRATLLETAAMPVQLTFRGLRAYFRAARDERKGRTTDYPVGHLKNEADLECERNEIMKIA